MMREKLSNLIQNLVFLREDKRAPLIASLAHLSDEQMREMHSQFAKFASGQQGFLAFLTARYPDLSAPLRALFESAANSAAGQSRLESTMEKSMHFRKI